MTLICVCADKRYRLINSNGTTRNDDTNHKIFSFKDLPLVILNHGINRFKNRDWKKYCSDYETSGRWRGKDQFQIVNDFSLFIEKDVVDELNLHKNDKYAVGFLICGKTFYDTKYKVNELFWIIDNGMISFQTLRHKAFIQTGDDRAKQYIRQIISNTKVGSEAYWKNMKLLQMENELRRLFLLAVGEKKKVGGEEFSDEFETKSI